jgi:hypothetical protein
MEHKFTEAKLLEELEMLIQSIAENIQYTIGEEAALAILKQSHYESEGSVQTFHTRAELDMDQYPITHTFRLAYDYVMNARWPSGPMYGYFCEQISEPLEDLATFMELSGQSKIEDSYCRYIHDAAFARWYVDEPEEENYLDFKGVALLARVDERTVRNAALDSAKNHLITIKQGGRTYITPKDALEWLKTRPGFKQTEFYEVRRDEKQDQICSISDLGHFIATSRNELQLTQSQLLEKLNWETARLAELQAIELGERICQFEEALPLANALNLEPEWFLGKVLETGYPNELKILKKTIKSN